MGGEKREKEGERERSLHRSLTLDIGASVPLGTRREKQGGIRPTANKLVNCNVDGTVRRDFRDREYSYLFLLFIRIDYLSNFSAKRDIWDVTVLRTRDERILLKSIEARLLRSATMQTY